MEQTLTSPRVGVRPRGQNRLRLALLLAMLVCLGAAGSALYPALSASASGSVDGVGWEGRRLVAQLLWAKSHAVMHAGVEERPARPGEVESRAAELHTHEHDGDGEGQEGHVYVIPPARRDFRGFLGHLERSVKPYLAADGKTYAKADDQTIPFYRLMTWADPHFIEGYTVGAYFLADHGRRSDAALAFLREGERNNPESFEIQVELGHTYLAMRNDPKRAISYLERALRLAPRGRALTEAESDSRLDGHRWLAYAYVRVDRPADALRIAYAGLRLSPGDRTCLTVIAHRGRDWMSNG